MDIQDFGPWFNMKPEQVRKAFISFADTSPWLEKFPGLKPATKPPADVNFEVIYDKVTVDPAKRDGLKLPCNLCGTVDKFCRPGVLILDEYGWPYFGGAVCGRNHFGDSTFNSRLGDFYKKRNEDTATEFLFDVKAEAKSWIQAARMLLPVAQQADKACADLQRTSVIWRTLKQAVDKEGGILSVSEVEVKADNLGKDRYFETKTQLVRLNGKEVFSSKNPKLADTIQNALYLLEPAGENEDEFFNTMAVEEKKGKIIRLANVYRRAVRMIRSVYATLLDYKKFFSEKNFEGLRRFGRHHLNPNRFGVEIGKSTRKLLPTVQKISPPVIMVEKLIVEIPVIPSSLSGDYAKEVSIE